jgi:transcriptional regulator with XRE-family HTH domain
MARTKEFLGRRIREIRKALKMSQERLAEKVDVDPRYISRIELGKCFPSLETLDKISLSLDVELRDLFDFSHFMREVVSMQEVVDLLDGADEHERQLILRVTKAVARAVKVNV